MSQYEKLGSPPDAQAPPNPYHYPQQEAPPNYSGPQTTQPQQYNYGYGMGPTHYSNQTTAVIQTPQPIMQYQQPAEDYMCRAIFATFCCFWPVGIFAIMKASEARSAYARGDVASGQSSSASARQLSNVAIGCGIASIVIAAIIVGVYVGVVLNYVNNINDNYN